ncbi:endoribonuclease L-PSP [Bacteroides sp. UBA939]|uniref:chorismate transformation enzyme, FkbO/Hyg5 family n=1 Tax=Bacteroides sp. UBA939 TaxID=1946092 RepID=UPI0025C665DA|nr:endoribonuclease L-PSP [Bacteroides sp. UBA939]
MNYCEKIHYSIYTTEEADFETMADTLLAQLPENEHIFRLIFFGTPADNVQYVTRRTTLFDKIERLFAERLPVFSYVSQPALDGRLTLEVHSYRADDTDSVAYHPNNGFPYVVLRNTDGRFLFAGGFHSDIITFNTQQQSVEIFRLASEVLHREGFPVESIIRQWNYIEQITGFDGFDQHYQMFNNVRSNFYKRATWSTGYPAATGIGTNLGGVLVDMDAAVFARPGCFMTAIDNKLQVAAHAYSVQVLENANEEKATPKFERAKSMTFDDRELIYVSGTAAIRGEESMAGVGLERQLHITMENIAQLIGNAQLKILRVYLKEKSDYKEAYELLDSYKLNVPISYMCADVCRNELLIEIEGIAIN